MEIPLFIKNISNQDVDERSNDMLAAMFRMEYTLNALDISARVLQNWYENGLLPYDNRQGKKHKFNFIELIWLFIVQELRGIGLPIKIIKKVKEHLLDEIDISELLISVNRNDALDVLRIFNYVDQKDNDAFNDWYEKFTRGAMVLPLSEIIPLKVAKLSELFMIINTIFDGTDRYFLTISSEGEVRDFSSSQFSDFANDLGQDIRIVLPLNKFFYKYVEDYRNLDFLSEIGLINKNEAELLTKVQQGQYDEIQIVFRDQKMKQANYKKEIKKSYYGLMAKIVAQKKYQDIVIKTENGDIVYAALVTKNKFN